MNKAKLLLLSAVLVGSLVAPMQASSSVSATSNEAIDSAKGMETFRVYVESNTKSTKNNIKNQYDVRWELTENGFSTNMNQKQFDALQNNKNITVTKVEKVTLDADLRSTEFDTMA